MIQRPKMVIYQYAVIASDLNRKHRVVVVQ